MQVDTRINSQNPKEMDTQEITEKITIFEQYLTELRQEYLSRTGELPASHSKKRNWKWTIFMTIGFAYISCVVYYFGVRKTGQGEDFGIPEFLYAADVQYFAVLTFFIIFAIVNIQSEYLRGYQILVVLFGFWCMHWLIYDWAWWALDAGFNRLTFPDFWTDTFYSPLLIIDPPMWLFLLESILGAIVSIYTFSIPNNYVKLIPSFLWLYTVYANATVCQIFGLDTPATLVIGIILIIGIFTLIGIYTYRKIKQYQQETSQTIWKKLVNSFQRKNWDKEPLAMPFVLLIPIAIGLYYIIMTLNPVLGYLFSMMVWFFFPAIYFFVNTTRYKKFSTKIQILNIIGVVLLLFGAIIFLVYSV